MNYLRYDTGKLKRNVKNVKVIVIHAGFGDATLLEVTDYEGVSRHYLVDGGPTTHPRNKKHTYYFQNLLETFLERAFKVGENTFKADGIMITHPHADHVQGIMKIFQNYPPNQTPSVDKPRFEFKGPLLLTTAFEAPKYRHYLKIIENANFKKNEVVSLDGFEDMFTFFYSNSSYQGALYSYSFSKSANEPSGNISNPSDTNTTSILLTINDHASNSENILVSLNGDAYADIILKSLNGLCPKVFKVPHHGSVNNSLLLKRLPLYSRKSLCQLFAMKVLLEIALKNDTNLIDMDILGNSIANFQNKKFRTEIYATRNSTIIVESIMFLPLLLKVAQSFSRYLLKSGNVSEVVFKNIHETLQKIFDDINNGTNTTNTESVEAFTSMYQKLKKEVVNASIDPRSKRARSEIFSVIENDYVTEHLKFVHVREFYNKVNAQTYIISSGDLYNHPNWQVINGIIAAAHDQHKKDINYKCRLLLTSGNNIKGLKLQELYTPGVDNNILTDDWTNYVSLQYFAVTTASVEINSNEEDPTVPLKGTIKWESSQTDAELCSLIYDYRKALGARELKNRRAIHSGMYEIKPLYETEHKQWLALKLGSASNFVLSNTKIVLEAITLKKIISHEGSPERLYLQFQLIQESPPVVACVYGVLGEYTTNTEAKMCKLFLLNNRSDRVYLLAKHDGELVTSLSKSSATTFQFKEILNVPQPFEPNSDTHNENYLLDIKKKVKFSTLKYQNSIEETDGSFSSARLVSSPSNFSDKVKLPFSSGHKMVSLKSSSPSFMLDDTHQTALEEEYIDWPQINEPSMEIKYYDTFSKIESPSVQPIEMSLKKFLAFVNYSDATKISSEELLSIVVSHQFVLDLYATMHANTSTTSFFLNVLKSIVDENSKFVVQESDVKFANIKVVLSSKLMLHAYRVVKVYFTVDDPKTVNQKVTLQVEANDGDFPVTLHYHLKTNMSIQSFHEYLISLGITKNPSNFNMFDVIMTLLQSELSGYFYVSSLSQSIIGHVLNWNINEEESVVEFISFPTGPILLSADIVAKIPVDLKSSIDLKLSHPLQIKKVQVILPSYKSRPSSSDIINDMHLLIAATINGLEVSVSCFSCSTDESDDLPQVELKLVKPVSLGTIVDMLVLNDISSFTVPLISKHLKDVSITNACFTLNQVTQNSQQMYLSKVAIGISFTNISHYLPPSFSNLKSINSHVIVFQPKIPPIQIALEVDFEFQIKVTQEDKEVYLMGVLATRPVNTDSRSDYDITVSVHAGSNHIGTSEGAISIADFLGAFNSKSKIAFNAVSNIPFFSSLLQNVKLKKLLLNMQNANITAFSLDLIISDWKFLSDKIVVNQTQITLYYEDSKWAASFDAIAVFCSLFTVNVMFEFSNIDGSLEFMFKNSNSDFTISKFLEIFGLDKMNNLPIVDQFLSVSITEASLQMIKNDTGHIIIKKGSLSLYIDFIKIGSLLSLSQVNATITFWYDDIEKYHEFSFVIDGFINEKLYIKLEYDPVMPTLMGKLSVAASKKASLFEVLTSFITNTELINKNDLYNKIAQSPTINIEMSLTYKSGNFNVERLVIQLSKVVSIGSLSLDYLSFRYNCMSGTSLQQEYSLSAKLANQGKNIGAILTFDLTVNSTKTKIISASIEPTHSSSLSLKKFLFYMLGSDTQPIIPTIEGQKLPNYFDIVLTKGVITFTIPSFDVQSFTIHFETDKYVTIFISPLIILKNLSLKVEYDKNRTPSTTATLLGIFTIGGIELTIQGNKEPNGDTVFKVIATSEHVNFQKSINTLTPTDSTSPVIPSDIGLPKPLNMLVAELIVKYSPSNHERSIFFSGTTQLNWSIDIGFQQFTVKQLGGKVSYRKSTITQSTSSGQYTAFITGKFQFSDNIRFSSELQFGHNVDTVLLVLVTRSDQIQIPSVANDLLGFHNTEVNSIRFESLLPDKMQVIKPTKIFVNINISQKIFGLFGQIGSLGSGFLIAGNFSQSFNARKYGYAFGISLPLGFQFSNLLSQLAPIDNVLTIRKANCMIVSFDNIKVSDVVAKLQQAQKSAILPLNESKTITSHPFSNLTLDDFTSGQYLSPGLSLYCELDFNKSTLFNSIIQISKANLSIPDVILSSFIHKDPMKSIFTASISSLILLGSFKFLNIKLIYKPASHDYFELQGTLIVTLGDSEFEFLGQFSCTDVQSKFKVSTGHEKQLASPLGMFGISLQKAQLLVVYDYPTKDKPVTSKQTITGSVNFYSKHSSLPSVTLACLVHFVEYTPTVVEITLNSSKPLTIGDLVATVLDWNYDTTKYLNIEFLNGQIYYAALHKNQNSITIEEKIFEKGYHMSAEIEIFDSIFVIKASISQKGVEIIGETKHPIHLGFAKFTGKNQSSGPAVTFITNEQKISVSLTVGVFLFDTFLGRAEIGLMLQNGIKKFFGTLEYDGSIFNTSISFEWSREYGFQIVDCPAILMIDAATKAFRFFDELTKFSDKKGCGDLVGVVFKEGIKAKFNISVTLSKPKNKSDIANIDITGTYDILLLDKVGITSVPLPDISEGIPNKTGFTLSDIPEFILELLAKKGPSIVQQIADDPERLVELFGVVALKHMTKKLVEVLFCRGVTEDAIDPDIGGRDITEGDMNEVNENKINFDKNVDLFKAPRGTNFTAPGGGLPALAGFLSQILYYGGICIGLLGGIVTVIETIKHIKSYLKKEENAKIMEKEINDKITEIQNTMNNALDIQQPPDAIFTPPDSLELSWKFIEGARYHVLVKGTLIDETHLGQKSNQKHTIYEKNTSRCKIELQDEIFYNVVGLTVSVNATVKSEDGKEFNGKIYTADVPNVHPTLHSLSKIDIAYHHLSRLISITTAPVQYANTYYFELIDNNRDILDHCTYTLHSDVIQIQCNLTQSSIKESSVSPFKIKGQAIAKSGSGIASSSWTFSESLDIVPSPTNLELALPHFMEQNQSSVNLKWMLPASTSNISGFLFQIFDIKFTKVIMNKEISSSPLADSAKFQVRELIEAIERLKLVTDDGIFKMKIRVSSCSKNTKLAMDSTFIEKVVVSLQPPEQVSFGFDSDTNSLKVYWKFSQETNKYGVQIIDSVQHKAVLSKQIIVKEEPSVAIIPASELSAVNDTTIQYTVQVISVAIRNDTFDSFFPSKAKDVLKILTPPILSMFEYEHESDSVMLSYLSVTDAFKYKISICTKEQGTIFVTKCFYQKFVKIKVDDFIDKLVSTDIVKCFVQSLGKGSLLNSTAKSYENHLTPLPQPINLTYDYNVNRDTIAVTCELPKSISENVCRFLFIDKTRASKKIEKTKKGDTEKVSAYFSAVSLIYSQSQKWNLYVQSCLTKNSNHQIPSTLLPLNEDIEVLKTPYIKSLVLNTTTYATITITVGSIKHCTSYKVNCKLYTDEKKFMKDITKIFQEKEEKTEVVLSVDLADNDDKQKLTWSNIFPTITEIRVRLVAEGHKYFLTSKSSLPMSIVKEPILNCKLVCDYSSSDDTLTLSSNVNLTTTEATLGFECVGNTASKVISKIVTPLKNKIFDSFEGQQLRDSEATEWIPFLKLNGSSTYLASDFVKLKGHIHSLEKSEITLMTYDPCSTALSVNWTSTFNAYAYKVTITYKTQVSKTFSFSKDTNEMCLTVFMNKEVKVWNEIFESVNSVIATVTSLGNGRFINSNKSASFMLKRVDAPSNVTVQSDEGVITLKWNKTNPSDCYIVTIIDNKQSKPFTKSVTSNSISIPKRLFLQPTKSVTTKSVYISVSAVYTDKHLGSFPVNLVCDLQTQQIYNTEIFGFDFGIPFDDGLEYHDIPIIGIKSLNIHYGKSLNLQANYYLSNGSTYVAPTHGNKKEFYGIELSRDEAITGVTALSGSFTGLGQFIVVTKKFDGSCCRYGPFGKTPMKGESIQSIYFSGNVLSFKGKCRDDGFTNGLGFNYTFASPIIYTYNLCGGDGGIEFDHQILTNEPSPIVGIKRIKLSCGKEFLVSIQPTYIMDNGQEWEPFRQGRGVKDIDTEDIELEFEDNEKVISISGKTYTNCKPSIPIYHSPLITEFSIITQKKNHTIKQYGPFAGHSSSPKYTVRGNILGFYGNSDIFVDRLGVYYSLQRSEILGNITNILDTEPFDDKDIKPHIVAIKTLYIKYSDIRIESVQVDYILSDGTMWKTSCHGSEKGNLKVFNFDQGEDIVKIILHTYEHFQNFELLDEMADNESIDFDSLEASQFLSSGLGNVLKSTAGSVIPRSSLTSFMSPFGTLQSKPPILGGIGSGITPFTSIFNPVADSLIKSSRGSDIKSPLSRTRSDSPNHKKPRESKPSISSKDDPNTDSSNSQSMDLHSLSPYGGSPGQAAVPQRPKSTNPYLIPHYGGGPGPALVPPFTGPKPTSPHSIPFYGGGPGPAVVPPFTGPKPTSPHSIPFYGGGPGPAVVPPFTGPNPKPTNPHLTPPKPSKDNPCAHKPNPSAKPTYGIRCIKIVTEQQEAAKKKEREYDCGQKHSSDDKEFVVNGRVIAFFGQVMKSDPKNINSENNPFLSGLGVYYVPL